jgi:hypothetical protein
MSFDPRMILHRLRPRPDRPGPGQWGGPVRSARPEQHRATGHGAAGRPPEPGAAGPPGPPLARAPIWGGLVVGDPIIDFEPRPPVSLSYRPDSVADGWSTRHFTVRLASVRGYAHRHRGIPRQDDVAATLHRPTGTVVFAVADGVSAAPQSHIGATVACRAALTSILADLDGPTGEVDWQNLVRRAAWQLIEQTRVTLGLPDADAAQAERELATTLVAGTAAPTPDGCRICLVQVGDSGAWVLHDGVYRWVLGGKQHTDEAVVSSRTTALPRVPTVTPRTVDLPPDAILLVGTDGFGDPLGDGTGLVGHYFAQRLARPRPPLHFAYNLDFSRETFDDDRTLLALWSHRAR